MDLLKNVKQDEDFFYVFMVYTTQNSVLDAERRWCNTTKIESEKTF